MAEVKAVAELVMDTEKLEQLVGRKLDAGALHLLQLHYGEELLCGPFQLFLRRSISAPASLVAPPPPGPARSLAPSWASCCASGTRGSGGREREGGNE